MKTAVFIVIEDATRTEMAGKIITHVHPLSGGIESALVSLFLRVATSTVQ